MNHGVINRNKELLGRLFGELAQGNGAPFLEHMAEDCRWYAIGSTAWSGAFEGKAEIRRRLLGPLRSRVQGGALHTVASRILADGNIAVVEARGNNRTTLGRDYNNEYCFVIRLSGEPPLMREITEYMDTELATAALGDPDPEEAGVLQTVALYFQGHATGDPRHMRDAFTPEARIQTIRDGALIDWSLPEYCALFKGSPAPDESSRKRILDSIRVSGHAAGVRLTLVHGPQIFTDYLSMLRSADGWRIVHKVFSVTSAAVRS
jgi:ketosteroid isomerase-like protein